MFSTITHLECTYCSKTYSADELHTTCPACGRVLYARYDLKAAARTLTKESLVGRRADMWRYHEVMPVKDPGNVLALGEGYTPLIHARRLGASLGCDHLYIKEEGVNPTGSFKARGLCAAVSKAKELGVQRIAMPSAGNAAGAVAAYGAEAGMQIDVFMPKDVPLAFRVECSYYGAGVHLVDGLINDAGRESRIFAEQHGCFDTSTLREPYRQEGKKTMGYEIAEQMQWKLPDAILYPTGGGTGIVGMWKAFQEMEAMGWIDSRRPKMISVQSATCAPIARAFEQGKRHADLFENAHTIAAGLRVPVAIGDYLILDAVRQSGGTVETVKDEDLLEGVREISSKEGIFACPEGGAVLMACKQLLAKGFLKPSETIVLFNTGTALKYLDVVG